MRILKTLLWLGFVALASADPPIDWDVESWTPELTSRDAQQVYRLPDSVLPQNYNIFLDLYFDERTEKPFSYEGRVYVSIKAVKENVSEIVLHANVDSINSVTLNDANNTIVPIEDYDIEQQYHFLKIKLTTPLNVNTLYELFIDYSGSMNEGPMKRGIWKGSYTDENNVERIYATTHFQPYNARQAFPCWDEPLFKATFKLHITRPANYTNVFTNTKTAVKSSLNVLEGRVDDHFEPTPVMSSYLVTFLVSENFKVIAEDTTFDPPVRIIGRSNTAGLGDHALKLAVGMTKYFNAYFDKPYATLDPNLNNDHVASPDWASAGTENWGMVSYKELHLILDPTVTIMSVEQYSATLVSHELAHKWFGNLITCYWWSNTWINEGYASYFGYIATHQVFPEYELHEHFNSRYLQNSLSVDSGTGTVPLNYDVNTPAQVTGHFGTISYSKGAAFLRMTANMIGSETFKKSCRYFLNDNAYKATDQYDLYNAFAKAIDEDKSLQGYQHFNFTEYYDVWVNQPGYPILIVNVNHATGEIELKQERFFLSASATPSEQIYPIPITYSTKSQPNFAELKPSDMMTGDRMMLQKDNKEEWVIFNHQQNGHYRVTYDTKTWSMIGEALRNERDSIHHLNRAQVVDDVFALMRSTKVDYSQGFQILRFLRNEDNYHVWTSAISGFSWIRSRLRHIPENQATFDSFVLSYMEHVINKVGFEPSSDETPTVSLLRQEVLQFACNLGHEKCVQESVRQFTALKQAASVDRRILRSVYVNGIREGGVQDFEFLYGRFVKSNIANDKLEMLRAMGATKDPELLNRYLKLTLTTEVRPHDKVTSFNYALLGHPHNAITVLQFVKQNIDQIRIQYVADSPANPINSAMSSLASYLDESGLTEYEEWLRETQGGTAQFNSTISAINSARANIAWGTNNAEIILAAARDSARTTTGSLVLLAIAFIVVKLM
ncbi:hypothetical protein ACJJTC_011459 [Scirpophaga incertulas]